MIICLEWSWLSNEPNSAEWPDKNKVTLNNLKHIHLPKHGSEGLFLGTRYDNCTIKITS